MKTLFLPITTNGDSIPVHVQLHRDITSNTVIITLSPDVLIVNETGLKLQIITLSKGVIVMDNNERNVTALVSRNEVNIVTCACTIICTIIFIKMTILFSI